MTPTKTEDEIFTDLTSNVNELIGMIQFLVDGKRDLRQEHQRQINQYDARMLAFAWRCRGLLSTARIAKLLGISRQRLYEKWQEHGYSPNDDN